MTRRAPIVILLCLMLGAFTTIALAMLCAAYADPTNQPAHALRPPQPGPSDILIAQRCFGHTRLNRARVDVVLNEHTGEIISSRWMNEGESFSESQAGWPLRALRCENHGEVTIILGRLPHNNTAMRMNRSGLKPVTGGWELRDFQGGQMGSTWRAIPLQPLWGGLIADTLIFAAMWWLLLAGTGIARGVLRRRRGLCPACGYDLRSGGVMHERCPECGRSSRRRTDEHA